MADRSWERGLHQLIETKECCNPSGGRETLAQTTYQRFFQRYLWLAGMTGTAAEIATELDEVYDLPPSNPSWRTLHLELEGAHCAIRVDEELQSSRPGFESCPSLNTIRTDDLSLECSSCRYHRGGEKFDRGPKQTGCSQPSPNVMSEPLRPFRKVLTQ